MEAPDPQLPPKRPWKALSYYEEEDADLFFGRASDRRVLLSHILSFRSTVLYGPSGTGKTSLLNAGVIPALRRQGYRVAIFRVAPDPIAALRAAVCAAWSELIGKPFTGADHAPDWPMSATVALNPGVRSRLQDLLTARLSLDELHMLCANLRDEIPGLDFDDLEGGRTTRAWSLIAFLERREQLPLLVRALYRERADLRDELEELLAPGSVNGAAPLIALDQLRFPSAPPLVVVFDEFEKFFHDDFVPLHARAPFIAEIVRAAARSDLPIKWVFSLRKEALGDLFTYVEPQSKSLIANLYRLDPLNREQAVQAIVGPAEKSGFKLEAGLIECLLDDLAPNGTVEPPQLQIVCDALYDRAEARQTNQLSLDDYRHEGGATGILQDYLTRVLERFPLQDIEAVKDLLIQLAGAQETTLALSLMTLADHLDRSPDQVVLYLQRLKEASLIREVSVEGRIRYELTHAYLLKEINSWLGREALALKHLQDIVARGAQSWDLGVWLSVEALNLLFPHRASLRLSAEERRLIWHSAVLRGDHIREWAAICREEAEQLSILDVNPPLPQPHVLEALRWIDTPAAVEQLVRMCVERDDPLVCRLAAEKLTEMDAAQVQSALIAQARTLPGHGRLRHECALAVFADRGKLPDRMPLALRLGVGREVVGLRLRRRFDYIMYLIIGAALGSLPLFTIAHDTIAKTRFEPIGIGLAMGIGVGYALSSRHRRRHILFGAMIGGLAGGGVSGLIGVLATSPIDVQDIPFLVSGWGIIGWLLATIAASGMLLTTRRRDSWQRRIVGLILGSLVAPMTFIGLLLITNSSLSGAQSNLLFASVDMALIGLGIGLAEYFYQRNSARPQP